MRDGRSLALISMGAPNTLGATTLAAQRRESPSLSSEKVVGWCREAFGAIGPLGSAAIDLSSGREALLRTPLHTNDAHSHQRCSDGPDARATAPPLQRTDALMRRSRIRRETARMTAISNYRPRSASPERALRQACTLALFGRCRAQAATFPTGVSRRTLALAPFSFWRNSGL